MLMTDFILCKDYTDEIQVNGINMYEPDTIQYSLYKVVKCSDQVKEMLDIEIGDDKLIIFPFQCGIKFGNGYHLMNIRDCIGALTLSEIEKAYKGEL